MTYSFSGHSVEVPRGRFCLFWAANPHRKIKVQDDGTITIINVSVSEFLRWALPAEFVSALLGGAVIIDKSFQDGDIALANRLASEITKTDIHWQRLHAMEMQTRLNRMAI